MKGLYIISILLFCSCSRVEKPMVVKEVQVTQANQFSPVNSVSKSMIRALAKISQNDSLTGSADLTFMNLIDQIYYYNSMNSNRTLDTLLGARLDSIVSTESYFELSEIMNSGKTYGVYIKNEGQIVNEILILQQSSAEILLISVLGEIKLEEIMKNINQLPKLLEFADAMPL